MNNSQENWLPVAGNPKYEVSDLGNVRGPQGLLAAKAYETKPGGPRYRRVHIPGMARKNVYVHRLVVETFVGPAAKGMQCRHLNGDSLDNRLVNLRWGTPSENNYDRVRHGTHQHSTRDHCPKGHPKDGIARRRDGSVQQRVCKTCQADAQRRRRERRLTTCSKGHPFDGVAVHANGLKRRYCKQCRSEQVTAQMTARWAVKPTHCKRGHLIDGVNKNQRFCRTCKRDNAAKRAGRAA